MKKAEYLKDIQYLVSRPEFEALPDEEILSLYWTIRKKICRDNKFPICQTVRFACYLNGPLYEDGFRATVEMLDPSNPLPSKMDLEWIMDHYGIHGTAQFLIRRDCVRGDHVRGDPKALLNGELRISNLVVYQPGSALAPSTTLSQLTPRQARMLNQKADGRTQKEIAAIENCSITTVADQLYQATRMASRYGFWQIWPKSVEMRFSDSAYVKALRTRGKALKKEE